jgi:hypothetical protein
MRRQFECGHRGLGKFCHRCANEQRPILLAERAAEARRARRAEAVARTAAEATQRQAELKEAAERAEQEKASHRVRLQELAAKAQIDLSAAEHLPAVLERALDVLARLDAGSHPLDLGGQRLTSRCGKVFSVPVGLRHRFIVDAASMKPEVFVSHEDYNGLV